MDPTFTQQGLFLSVTIQSTDADLTVLFDQVVVHHLEGNEKLSHPFSFTARFSILGDPFDPQMLLGQELTFTLSLGEEISPRYFSGVVGRISLDEALTTTDTMRTFYQVTIYPAFWLLRFTKDYRIFQNQTVLEIVKNLLDENQISYLEQVTERGSEKRVFCVQYGESTFDFISRLLEEEGIFYTFDFSSEGHILILSDSSLQAPSINAIVPLSEEDYAPISVTQAGRDPLYLNVITKMKKEEQIVPQSFKSLDYNYEMAATHLAPSVQGGGLLGSVYDFPGRFDQVDQGDALASIRLQSYEWEQTLIEGQGTSPYFQSGFAFSLVDHPVEAINQTYCLQRVSHKIYYNEPNEKSAQHLIYENNFAAFPMAVSFRPKCLTLKPRIFSNQTATVTGPEGEEIFCNSFGSIKVQFRWDIRGTFDENSSCWVRVAQNWAGSGWGGLVIPRIGMEVVLTFEEGDPDRPLVIGCVYNSSQQAPSYAEEAPTKSTFRSNSSKGGEGYNEIRFEDAADDEEIYMHAQKDVTVEIENNRTETLKGDFDKLTITEGSKFVIQEGVGTEHAFVINVGDQSTTILKGDQTFTTQEGNHEITITSGNCERTLTEGDHTTSITTGDHKVEIETGNQEVTITAGDQITTLADGDKTIEITSGDFTITLDKGDKAVTLTEGDASTTLKQGDKTIELTSGDFTITLDKGDKTITLKAGDFSIDLQGGDLSVNVKGDMDFTATGDISFKADNISLEASSDIDVEAGSSLSLEGSLMASLDGGLMTDVSGGLLMGVAGGLLCGVEGGLMCGVDAVLKASMEGMLNCSIEGLTVKIN